MGILDEAIREHLDLKRRLGAADDEIARLEGEAFGPPSRPGEPDFPETGEQAQAAEGEAQAQVAQAETPAEPVAEVASAPPEVEQEALEAAGAAEPEPAQASFYDHTAEEEDLELEDLDLELEDIGEEPSAEHEELTPEEPVQAPAAEGAPAEPPIESLDTVEHPAPIEAQDTVEHDFDTELSHDAEAEYEPLTGEEEVVEGSVVEEGAEGEEFEEEGEGEGEDVLEETPEFLRDQPEDDELWFEQGEPKDFDF